MHADRVRARDNQVLPALAVTILRMNKTVTHFRTNVNVTNGNLVRHCE